MAILDFFISQLIKTGCFLEVIWQLGTLFSGHCCCREVVVSQGSTVLQGTNP